VSAAVQCACALEKERISQSVSTLQNLLWHATAELTFEKFISRHSEAVDLLLRLAEAGMGVAVCCRMLQCVAVCCSVL